MRPLTLAILAIATLALESTSAHAFSFSMIERNGVDSVSAGDTIIIDVFLDAEAGLNFFAVGIIYDEPAFTYNPTASQILPIIYPAPPFYGDGSQPAYILYAPRQGVLPYTGLYPQQTPFQTWPVPPAGKGQVNINYLEANANPTRASGTEIWIASLVFSANGEEGTIEVTASGSGNLVRADDMNLDPNDIEISSPLHFVPEPATASLLVLGLIGLAATGRRQRSLS